MTQSSSSKLADLADQQLPCSCCPRGPVLPALDLETRPAPATMNGYLLPEIRLLRQLNQVSGVVANKGNRHWCNIQDKHNINSAPFQFLDRCANVFHRETKHACCRACTDPCRGRAGLRAVEPRRQPRITRPAGRRAEERPPWPSHEEDNPCLSSSKPSIVLYQAMELSRSGTLTPA